MIKEGDVVLNFDMPEKVSKELPVFYNPVMKRNRDISLEILRIVGKKWPLRIALPLAGSGIRGLRFLKEANEFVKEITFNDYANDFESKLKVLLKVNKIPNDKVHISCNEANKFLLDSTGFDYIDIDPFGTPNPFLDASVQRLARGGILAVTATDTSALAGTYIKVCRRNYDAEPLRNGLKHYVGIRILIRKIQLIGAQYEKALIPIFTYSKDHYYRVFLRCVKSKTMCDEIISEQKYMVFNRETQDYTFSNVSRINSDNNKSIYVAGKLFSGALWEAPFDDIASDISFISSEAKTQGHMIDVHSFCEHHKLPIPNFKTLESELLAKKYTFSRTHFNLYAIVTTADSSALIAILNAIANIS